MKVPLANLKTLAVKKHQLPETPRQPNGDHPRVLAWPPLIFAGCAVSGTLVHFIFPVRVTTHSVSVAVGVILAMMSASLAIWAERLMKAAGTNVRPNKPSIAVVSKGPYRFTRNPMYLSLCLLQLAIGFFLNGWVPVASALVLGLVLHFGVVLPEEVYLTQKFGEEHLSVKRRVDRWL